MEQYLVDILESSLQSKALFALIIAFTGGVISSITPCTLSILPLMVGYIGGYSDDNIKKAFINSLLFVAGFTFLLTIVGLVAAFAGKIVSEFIGPWWFIFLAIISILMGLSLLEVFYIQLPRIFKEMPKSKYGKIFSPIILGIAFGTMATPCSTPILLTLLAYVAYEGNPIYGTIALISYAVGHGILLLICGTFTGAVKQICKMRSWSSYITKTSGVLLILIGIYLFIYSIFPQFKLF